LAKTRVSLRETLLDNGKVLVTGGSPDLAGPPDASAELYDPAVNAWSSAGSASVGCQAATLLKNGKVLLTGARDSAGNFLNNAELYDPGPRLSVGGFPLTITVGISGAFTVTAQNSDGTTNSSYTGTIHLSSSDPRALLPADYTFTTADRGAHSFTIALSTAGSQTLTATDQVDHTLTATTAPITVSPSVASKMVVSLPAGNTVAAGSPFLVTAQAADQFGNPVTTYAGPTSVTAAASPPDPQADSPITCTLSSGGFGFFLVNLKTAGTYTLALAAGSVSGASSSITVTPGTANHFAVTAPVTATTGSSINVKVTALDPFGNVAAGYSGQIHFTSSDSRAILPPDSTLAGGIGNFTLMLNAAGSQTIAATDTVSTNPTVTGTSSAITTRGLAVTAFTPTATGFAVSFSKPIVASDINLYGGTVANPIQNVALVGRNTAPIFGPVNGVLVIDPAGTRATFKASTDWLQNVAGQADGLLPNDTWTATLQSGTGTGASANGFFDALGAPLDGTNSGGNANFVTTFATTNDGKPALTFSDFARGPDGANTIKVPNNSAKDIPVTFANAPAGAKDVVFTLNYNPALLTPTGAGIGDTSGTGSLYHGHSKQRRRHLHLA
jgi:hypothetical protein